MVSGRTTSAPPPDRGVGASAAAIARMLLDIGAVRIRPEDPFVLTSGQKSPVYVDCRRIISHPEIRRHMMRAAFSVVRDHVPMPLAGIAGGETAGIPFAAWLSDLCDCPMLYIRKKAKGFGAMARIEGDVPPDAEGEVLLVEDLANDGGSKRSFVGALRGAGYRVHHALVVFAYGPDTISGLADIEVTLHALCDWDVLLATALADGRMDGDRVAMVRDFLSSRKTVGNKEKKDKTPG